MATTPVAVAESTVPILSHWIDGRSVEVPPERTAPVFDPATGAVIARVPRGGAAEVDLAVSAARRPLAPHIQATLRDWKHPVARRSRRQDRASSVTCSES